MVATRLVQVGEGFKVSQLMKIGISLITDYIRVFIRNACLK
jgi:hypothetical protein